MFSELISIFTDIADAIRDRNGGSLTYHPSDMAAAILAIVTKAEAVFQSKTVSPSTSSQTVTPDTGYDGLSSVQVNAVQTAEQATPGISVNSSGLITASATQAEGYVSAGTKSATQQLSTQAAATITPSTSQQTAVASGKYTTGAVVVGAIPSQYIVPSGSQTLTENDTYDVTDIAEVVVDVPSSGGGMNWQIDNTNHRIASSSYTDTGASLTVAVTGTYNVYWTGFRSSTSGTNGSQLYKNGSAYGSAQTTFSNSYIQTPKLTGVALSAGDVLTIRARSRGSSYYMCVGNLTIEQTA